MLPKRIDNWSLTSVHEFAKPQVWNRCGRQCGFTNRITLSPSRSGTNVAWCDRHSSPRMAPSHRRPAATRDASRGTGAGRLSVPRSLWTDDLRWRRDSNEPGTSARRRHPDQTERLKGFARDLANAVDKLRGGAEALQAAIGNPKRRKVQ